MKSTSFVIDYVVINIHHGSFKKFPLQVIVFYFVSWDKLIPDNEQLELECSYLMLNVLLPLSSVQLLPSDGGNLTRSRDTALASHASALLTSMDYTSFVAFLPIFLTNYAPIAHPVHVPSVSLNYVEAPLLVS